MVIGTNSPLSSGFLKSHSMTIVWPDSPFSSWIWGQLVVLLEESLSTSIVLTCGTKSSSFEKNLTRSIGIG